MSWRKSAERELTLSRELRVREDRERCESSLMEFVRETWHVIEPATPLVSGWAMDAICEHLEAVTDGHIRRLLINVPPGSSKSLLANVFWPAWEWAMFPHLRYVTFSYAAHLTERDNRRFRDVIQSQAYQRLFKHRFRLDKKGEEYVSNSMKGFKLATSVGGVGTGERGDRVILDDPHNVKEAESETVRNATVEWFASAMSNRLNNMEKSAIVTIMQRVNEGDVSGYILDKGLQYEHLMIPAEYENLRHSQTSIGWSDPRSVEGNSFWPERFSFDVLEEQKHLMGPYGYAGQYQQRPEPKGGGIIKRDWWQTWDEQAFPPMDYIMAYVDTAYTEKTMNDPSAMTVWGVFSQDPIAQVAQIMNGAGRVTQARSYTETIPRVMLMGAWTERLEFHALTEKVAATARKFKCDRVLIENKASGISVAQELQRVYGHEDFGVELNDPKSQDKTSRLYSVQHLFSDGMIFAPDRSWADMVITQVGAFPAARHDDLCFVAGTIIATNRGPIPIEQISEGDKVLTPIGYRSVSATGCTGWRPIVKRGGLIGTPEHPIYDLEKGWVTLDTVSGDSALARLTLCDLIQTIRQNVWNSTASSSDAWAESGDTTYPKAARTRRGAAQRDCTLPSGSTFLARWFRRVMRSITSTVTPSIAALRILSAYRCACIVASLRTSTWLNRGRTLSAFARSLLHGINLRPDVLGTRFTPQPAWAPPGLPRLIHHHDPAAFAFGAAAASPSRISERFIAQARVEPPEKTSRPESERPPAPTISPVYNLTVEGAHCYYANGVLVHNCDTVSGALRHLRDIGVLVRSIEKMAEIEDAKMFTGRPPAPLYPS